MIDPKMNVELYRSVKSERASSSTVQHDEHHLLHETESGKNNKGPWFGKRHWQVLNLCSLILVTYFMRMNISVAIVAMTDENASENKNIPTYNWSDKGVILSSFLWGYITVQVVAGWLGSQYGAKWLVVGAVGICSLFSLLIPLSAENFGSKGVIGCRIVQGLSQGFIYPSIYYFLGQWIPPNERALGSVVFASRAIGILIAMFGTGQIASSWYGWPMVFYFFGVLGLVWCMFFSYFGCNGPSYHSTISREEKLYIEKSLCRKNGSDKLITPWWDIFTSVPFWAVTSVQCGTIWVFWIVQTEIPIYISKVMKVDIGSRGTLSALPPLAQWILTYFFGFLSDILLNKNVWSIGIARKTMNSIGLFIPAVSLVVLANCGKDEPYKAVALLVITIGVNSACQSGFQLNLIDIAPNFAGILMGVSNTLAHLLAIFAPLCVQFFVKNEENPDEWKLVFYSSAAVYIVVGLLFIIYGSGDVQHWNDGWKSEGPTFGKRHWQILNLCSLIIVTYLMRMNLSVAIVAMTDENASENKNIPTYKWSDKGVILSSFLWGYIVMQVVAGWLGSQYGAKWFVVGAVAICSVFSFLIPISASTFGSKGVIGCRIVQGLSQGFVYPSMYYFLGQWIPPNERALGSVVFASRAIGILIAMFGTGLISSSWYGWPMVFYLFGVVGLVWCMYFSYFGCNGPSCHSTISREEKLYIEMSLCRKNDGDKLITPWWDIFTSVPFWSATSVLCGTIWVFWIVQTELPIYISKVMNFDIGSSGTLSALPPLAQWIMTFLFGFLSDTLLNKNVWSIGVARKTMNSIGSFIPAISLILLANCGKDEPYKAVTLLVITIGFNSAGQCGYQLNLIDIAPNFAGVLMGMSNSLAHLLAIFAPLCVQFLVKNEENPDEWKLVFYSSAAVYIVVGLLFVIFGSGDVQHWNDGRRSNGDAKEKKKLIRK